MPKLVNSHWTPIAKLNRLALQDEAATNEPLVGLANTSDVSDNVTALGNCSDEKMLIRMHYLPVIYSIIFLVGFPGNIVAISTYIFKMRPWKSSTIIMLNLAWTDLLYLTSLPFLIHYYASGENWIFGDFMCKFIRFGFHFNLYSSILFLTCFSIFRYLVIIHPLSCFSIHKTWWTVVACAVVWIISLVAVLPITFLITSTTRTNRSACLDFTSSDDLTTIKWYNLILTATTFCLPLVIVTLCYTTILNTLAHGLQTHSCLKQKARKLTILLLLVFYICFLPFHILRVIRIESRLLSLSCSMENNIHEAYIISRPLAALNTFGNLLLYVVVNNNFQQAICSIVRAKPKADHEQAKKTICSNNP
ncbi:PREDICTED: 2-oxoglutarate receptor 1 [Dipodomys ordii]|uniref:2-oxoglutarate receptor 1 n=1 Tax=Dipodomys ordii TaxID=10020 RepID=A0A1S3FPF5_DIPOR|nr:PREDICTED: 2-oxoglutarate receptor 1 [Dipodomys ordii]XP_042538591.1 2-oxoglutarate receptor 1 [Dipodomys spectabilis]